MTPAPSASSPRESTAPGERAVVWTVALAGLLVPLNSTMIAVALPRLETDLDASARSVTWLVTGYLLAMASLQPVAGKLGDRVGRRPLMLGGLVWFGLASVGAAAADGLAMLVVFRLQQAVAGALLMPNATALVREVVPVERLGRSLGRAGAAIALGAAAGPPLGGLLLALGGWRSIFLVNVPLVLGALALGLWALPRAARSSRGAAAFDRLGAVLLCATLVAGAWSLNGAGLSPRAASALATGAVVALALLVRIELRRPDPVLQPRLFARRAFSAAAAGVALSNLAMYVALLALPALLARRAGFTGATTGLLLATMSVASLVVTPLGGRLVDRAGSRAPAAAGLALLAAALVPLALRPDEIGAAAIAGCLLAAGAGTGLASSALQVAAVSAVGVGDSGVAAGVFSTSRYAGSIVGAALLGGPLAPAAHGFGVLFAVLVMAAAASAGVALLLPAGRCPPAPAAAPAIVSPAPGRA